LPEQAIGSCSQFLLTEAFTKTSRGPYDPGGIANPRTVSRTV